MTANEPVTRIGPLEFAPTVRRKHGWAFLAISFFSISMITFVSIGQAYILNQNLGIPPHLQGTISGDLVFWTEIVTLLLFGPAGTLMDRIGRKPVYAAGFAVLAVAYLLYPFATNIGELTIFRMIYAVGVVAVTGGLATVLADYPAERSRGKLIAIVGFLSGLGIVVLNQYFGSLPHRLVVNGFSGRSAGLLTHAAVAGVCLLMAVVVLAGLKGAAPTAPHTEKRSLFEQLTSGLRYARNPRILLSYAAAFVARGDQSIIGTFVPLWGTTAGIAMGMDPAEAVRRGTMMFVISQIAALLWSPVIGILIDRWNRVTALTVSMGLAAAGYLSLVLIGNPLDAWSTIFFILLGIGQISAFLGSQSLIGQEAPKEERGSVIGAFNISGAIGILLITLAGGRLFDGMSPKAPFLIVGAINLVVMTGGLFVRSRERRPASA